MSLEASQSFNTQHSKNNCYQQKNSKFADLISPTSQGTMKGTCLNKLCEGSVLHLLPVLHNTRSCAILSGQSQEANSSREDENFQNHEFWKWQNVRPATFLVETVSSKIDASPDIIIKKCKYSNVYLCDDLLSDIQSCQERGNLELKRRVRLKKKKKKTGTDNKV